MAQQIEIGELYEVLDRSVCGTFSMYSGAKYIRYTKIHEGEYSGRFDILDNEKNKLGWCFGCFNTSSGMFSKNQVKPVGSTNSITKNIMSLFSKFALAMKSEPEKTFIKAGVTNDDGSLTSDGQALFLAYLLKKNGGDFKTTVVDPILAEESAK